MNLQPHELIIDSFAGGGGASTGIFMATGRHPDVAINHDPEAVAMHAINHPSSQHHCKSIYHVDPDDVMREHKRPIGLAWFSPDCTHHSKARGGKPKEKHIRDLAWVVVHWAERAVYQGKRPRIIVVENVEEFKDWGPLIDGQADRARKGEEFERWVKALKKLGYKVEWREMRACDYGAPTIRKRLFIVARCDGEPIVWPEPTHGAGRAQLYRTAAECIDWNIPCPSIFERKRPLKENTMRRIAKGVQRYVIEATQPFIVNITHTGSERIEPIDEPLRTVTGAKRGEKGIVVPTIIQTGYGEREGQAPRVPGIEKPLGTVVASGGKHALVSPFLARTAHADEGKNGKKRWGKGDHSLQEPLPTVAASGDLALVSPFLAASSGPEYAAKPRSAEKPLGAITADTRAGLVSAFLTKFRTGSVGSDLKEPMHTITAGGKSARPAGSPHAMGMVCAHLAQHNAGYYDGAGHSADKPLSTVTATGAQQGLVTSHIMKMRGENVGHPTDEPLHTISAGGCHHAEVQAFLIKYYGTGLAADISQPAPTVTAKDRMGLVIAHGEEYVIVDIGMRMLTPRELYNAQGFPADYKIEFEYKGKPLTKTAQVRMCGNSVSPPHAAAIIRAQLLDGKMEVAA